MCLVLPLCLKSLQSFSNCLRLIIFSRVLFKQHFSGLQKHKWINPAVLNYTEYIAPHNVSRKRRTDFLFPSWTSFQEVWKLCHRLLLLSQLDWKQTLKFQNNLKYSKLIHLKRCDVTPSVVTIWVTWKRSQHCSYIQCSKFRFSAQKELLTELQFELLLVTFLLYSTLKFSTGRALKPAFWSNSVLSCYMSLGFIMTYWSHRHTFWRP